jgi:hypothetical protein
MLQLLLPVLGPILNDVAKRAFPDPAQAQKFELEMQMALLARSSEIQQATADIIKTEAASSHWLAANWRPLTMMIFVSLITARWFGWSAPGLSEAEALKLWSIVELAIGGYVIGRSAEKILPDMAKAFKNAR